MGLTGPEVCDKNFYPCSERDGSLPGVLQGPIRSPQAPRQLPLCGLDALVLESQK